jgi:sulfur carrier protein
VIRINGADRDLATSSVAQLLVALEIDQRGIAVAVDGEIIRRSAWEVTTVDDGSSVEIVTAVAGG